MRTTIVFIFTLLLTSPLHALLVDSSGYAIETTYRDGYYFFARCRFAAMEEQPLSDCQPLNAEGLQAEDFALLQQRLQAKSTDAKHSAARMQKIKWGLIALTTVGVLLTVHKLYKEKILQMLGSACCDGHHHHHHHHGLWQYFSQHLPRFDMKGMWRFFVREQQWRVPTFLTQLLAIVAVRQKSQADSDKQTVYEFLQTELLQLNTTYNNALIINVRSITAIEFMLYEIMRLRQARLEEQTTNR